jgi:hypothetical protein
MTIPKRQDIIDKAFQIHVEKNRNISSINPEVSEVKESGIWKEAKDALMRSENAEYKAYVEKEARSLGLIDDKIELGSPCRFEIDMEEALRSGVFICGGKGTTKTNLAKNIADQFMKLGYVVKVFDISKAWLKSSIPYVYEIETVQNPNSGLYQSCIYDLSKLLPKAANRFIAQVLASQWNAQVSEKQRQWIIYVFEEVQSLIAQGSLRSRETQTILRLLTSGRNYRLAYIAITQRPALTDTTVFELSFQRYFARMDGQNDLKKVGNYIGIEKARELQNLKLGEFIYGKGSETKWITTKEFLSEVKPRKVEVSKKPIEPIKTQNYGNERTLSGIVLLLIWLAILIVALSQH